MPKLTESGGLTLTASTATTQTIDQDNKTGARGVSVYVKTTAIGTGSITITIQGKDRISGDYYTLLAGAAVITNTTNRYWIFPGAAVTANVSANDELPDIWRILVTANNANPVTATVGWSTLA